MSEKLQSYSVDYFLESARLVKNCSIRTLNHEKNKQIVVIKMFDNKFMQNIYRKCIIDRPLKINKNTKMVVSYIFSTTRSLINLFCCKFQMIEIYDKLSTHGIIIEGNFNIDPLTKVPKNYYSGKSLDGTNVLRGALPIPDASYLVIDNHRLIKIMTGADLVSYKSVGMNVQCIQGERLMTNGRILLDEQKDDDTGMIVIAVDEDQNTLIIYHQSINKYNMISLLRFFKAKDAIIICNTDNSHIIWKECGINHYNKTDFIGNTNEIVSNVITFSS
uniref:Uncharacterized protein n=1 Tax=viral metagenome TaxID=1070528 RepID=A0A6C0CAY8_9ZZZZ